MKDFLKLCRYEFESIVILFFMGMYVLYIPMCFLFALLQTAGINSVIATIIGSAIFTIVFMIYYFMHNNDYFERLYNIVCIKYKEGDQYRNFEKIQKEIFLYEYGGKIDIRKNAEVVKASVERDKAANVFYAAVATIFGTLVGSIAKMGIGKDFFTLNIMFAYLIVILMYVIIGTNMPKKYFIQSAVESVEKELEETEANAKNMERNSEMLRLHQKGMSYKKIGKIYSTSKQAVEYACLNANCPKVQLFFYINKNKYIYDCLIKNGIDSIEKLKSMISEDEFNKGIIKYVNQKSEAK